LVVFRCYGRAANVQADQTIAQKQQEHTGDEQSGVSRSKHADKSRRPSSDHRHVDFRSTGRFSQLLGADAHLLVVRFAIVIA
jgi:hypothetical protein